MAEAFGDMLRRLRVAASLTQEALADLAGVSPGAVAALEQGKRRGPRLSTVRQLADALDLTPTDRAALAEAAAGAHAQHAPPSAPLGGLDPAVAELAGSSWAHDGGHDQSALPADERARAGALPSSLTRLIGRDETVAAIVGLLGRARLVTLSGPGGAGKSRIALAVAERMRNELQQRSWWLELGTLAESAHVEQLVINALQPSGGSRWSAAEVAARQLGESPALLVLDNCEHLVEACARLAVDLLSACPGLRVLATSRRPLGAPGEQVWRVAGLALPPALRGYGVRPDPAGDEASAVELFVERATFASPSFALSDANRPAAIRVCWWLDGLPLALELAAARVAVMSVPDIADRLERNASPLGKATRLAPSRQRTLDATLDWSHSLLTSEEQTLFRRLAVFAGTFSMDAVESICAVDPLDGEDVLDLLASLVEQSLVVVVDDAGMTRYRMLTTVARYAAVQLAQSAEGAQLQADHTRYFAELATREAGALADPSSDWPIRIALEHDNLHGALVRVVPSDPEAAGRITSALWPFWYRLGFYDEARAWLDRTVAMSDAMAPATGASVLAAAGAVAFLQCDYAVARERVAAALERYRELDIAAGAAGALQRLGSIEREQGRYERAMALHEEARAAWEELGDDGGVGVSLDYLAFAAWLSGDYDGARSLGQRGLSLLRSAGAAQDVAACLINLGAAAYYGNDPQAAQEHLDEALTLARGLSFQEGVAWSLNLFGLLAADDGDLALAASMLQESLTVHARLGDRWRTCSVLEAIAAAILLTSDSERACELLSAADAERDALGTPLPPAERDAHARAQAGLAELLGADALAAATRRGRAMPLERAVASASAALSARA